MTRFLSVFFFILSLGLTTSLQAKSVFSSKEQEIASRKLIERVSGRPSKIFDIRVTGLQDDGKDWYAYYREGNRIVLEANTGIGIASAYYDYLKKYCGVSMTWCGMTFDLPDDYPYPDGTVYRTSPYKYRYNLNYCTFNYSMSWWSEERWQKEIDWMAMNGINMPLAITGQNTVWQRVYKKLGIKENELDSFFCGPAYFSWFWMGNIDGWGGPLPQSFIDKHEVLQKFILKAERSLGMTPILPAFTGHVPPFFKERYPEVKIYKSSWCGFPEVSILAPDEDMFVKIGKLFLEEQTRLYGTNHFYSADTFNENKPPKNDPTYLYDISNKVYSAMSCVDEEAVWVMQGWLFNNAKSFWGDSQIRALLSGVPDENIIILDLWSEQHPVWNRTDAYYGKPWIWCMLHNFGGRNTLSGNVNAVSNTPAKLLGDLNAGNLCGIGLTMEAIEQTPFMYALMLENVWNDEPINIDDFVIDYVTRRYGGSDDDILDAWKILVRNIYENNVNAGGHSSIISRRPDFDEHPVGYNEMKKHYVADSLELSWSKMISVADKYSNSDGFKYDIVDVTRQVLADKALVLRNRMKQAYEDKNIEDFNISSSDFLCLILDLDNLLSCRKEFLLGCWIEDARAMGNNDYEKALYEKNARDLITLWGDKDSRLSEYCSRQWSGLLSGYYYQRWNMFIQDVRKAILNSKEFNNKEFESKCKEWDWQWVNSSEKYNCTPTGGEIDKCKYLFDKYY